MNQTVGTRRREIRRTIFKAYELGRIQISLAVTRYLAQIVLSQSLRSISRSRSDRSLAVARLALSRLLGTDRSPAVTQHGSLSRGYSSQIALTVIRRRSFSRSRSDLSLAVTRLSVTRHGSLSRNYSAWIDLLQLLGLDRSLAVTRIARKSRA